MKSSVSTSGSSSTSSARARLKTKGLPNVGSGMIKLFIVSLFLLSLTTSAEAIDYRMAYSGPVRWIVTNWDMGPVYDTSQITPFVLHDGAATLDALAQYEAPGRVGDEDNWGIFRVQEILTDDGFSNVLWGNGDDGKELVGMFYGGVDNALYIGPTTSQQTIQSSGWSMDLYEQDAGTLTNALISNGSGGRVALDKYEGIAFDGVGVQLNHARLVLEGVSTTGVAPLTGATGPAEARTSFTATSPITGLGGTDMYIDVTGGPWQYLPEFQYETDEGFLPPSPDGDLLLEIVAYPNNTPIGDWTVITDGPIRGNDVPEPATMVILSMGGLALLRRRRR